MGCCKCEEYGWADPQPVVYTDEDDIDYCVFHAPLKHKGISLRVFNLLVIRRIENVAEINSVEMRCNLSGTIFPGRFALRSTYTEMPAISFNSCVFSGYTDFDSVVFGLNVDFKKAIFKGFTSFGGSLFREGACFDSSIFHEDVHFWAATFSKGVCFSKVVFKQVAAFNYSNFLESSFFDATEFEDSVSFSGCKVQSIKFSYSRFSKFFDFRNISIDRVVQFYAAYIDQAEFMTEKSSRIELSVCRVGEAGVRFCDMNMERVIFYSTDLENIHFFNCQWPVVNGIYYVDFGLLGYGTQSIRDFYQRMKRKYKNEHNEYEASKWHISEKEAQLKLLKQNDESRWLLFLLWLYRTVSRYGEDPFRAGCVFGVLIFLPLLLLAGIEVLQYFTWFDFESISVNAVFKDWLRYLPLTKASVLEKTPGSLHVLMVFWQLLVTIQAALFAFAVRNRFRR